MKSDSSSFGKNKSEQSDEIGSFNLKDQNKNEKQSWKSSDNSFGKDNKNSVDAKKDWKPEQSKINNKNVEHNN